uniref:Reverse transcriptase domain-containing protein n=1 Tax=Tanacetum cinerariifolium TaxID=118510 RepID=A0A699HLG8_TANCI|nr:hypothetical protein [Tanacetum cinerariifolium]
MARSSTSKQFTHFKNLKREFRSSRRHFKTLSLDELRSPDFNLSSDQEYSKEEVTETMAETMKQYMSKTRADYGLGVARPKIKDKDNFELKGQFLKELHTNTFSSSNHEDASEHIEKVLEIVDLFHIPNITIDQVMLREFPMSLTGAASHWLRNEPTCSITTWGYREVAPGFCQRNNANHSYQERRQSMEDTLSKFMSESTKKHEENSKLINEIQASTDVAIHNQGASIKTLEIQIGQMRKGSHGPQFSEAYSKASQSIPRKEKDPGSFTLSCFINNVCFDNALVDLGASVSVMPLSTYLNLGIGELAHTKLTIELADRTVKYPKGIAKNVLDYIELNDLNEPFDLRRKQCDDLMHTIEEGEVIEEFRTRDDKFDTEIDDYPSNCDYDKKIHIDCAHNLKFSCMIGFEFTHANFFPLLYVNVMSKKFYNSIMKDKREYKGNNIVRTLMNIPIFVRTFSILTDVAVLEDMDAYRDEGIDDVIFGKPFLREAGIKTRWFDWMITIYTGNDEVTYQMMQSHLRYKQHINELCNKILPLLKVSEEDKMNGISHPYQKLKGFYKGVLNLGPDYI